MDKHKQNVSLLPKGFADLLPPEAEEEAYAIATLMKMYAAYGYKRVKPPLVEFEDSLFAPGPGAALPHETFRLFDPSSHRMMGIRSDITSQIARIASSRMSKEKRPLRLAYANDILRTDRSQHRTARQFCKTGCEIIGSVTTESNIEVCVLALLGLHKLGVRNITLDLTLPELVQTILDKEGINETDAKVIRDALDHRDIGRLRTLDNIAASGTLVRLVNTAGRADKAFADLEDIELPEGTMTRLNTIKNVYDGVQNAINELEIKGVQITIDPVEKSGPDYHNGLAFSIFCNDTRGVLGRGGGYIIPHQNTEQQEHATGFSLYMDTVREAMPFSLEKKERILVPVNTSWQTVNDLQDDGWIVIRNVTETEMTDGFTHILKNKQIIQLK